MNWWTGEVGNSYSTPNKHAETMNAPSKLASIAYSGQWARRHAAAPRGDAAGLEGCCAGEEKLEVISVAASSLACVGMCY